MDIGTRTPLLESFRRGEAPPDVRLVAAQGGLPTRASEQMEILLLLRRDDDAQVAATAQKTLEGLDRLGVAAFLARPEASDDARAFFAQLGVAPVAAANGAADAPLVDTADLDAEPATDGERDESTLQRIAGMNVAKRMALAMKGTREERGILIRDPNRIVTAAVLSSPKMTETEIAGIARMANVSDDVLRTIANNRAWLKNYSVALSLVKNPKTPVALSMGLLARLSEKDLRMLSTDRNVPTSRASAHGRGHRACDEHSAIASSAAPAARPDPWPSQCLSVSVLATGDATPFAARPDLP
jgi:hypothetical protein